MTENRGQKKSVIASEAKQSKRLDCFVALLLAMTLLSGCGQKKENVGATLVVAQNDKERAGTSPAPTMSVDPATAGTLRGKVSFEGVPPARAEISVRGNPECAIFHKDGKVLSEETVVNQGGLQNVFVYIKEGLENHSFQAPAAPVEIDNKNCVYVPHVSGAQVGQPVVFLNSDATLHNIHAYAKRNKSWNIGLPFQGVKQTKKFDAPEVMVSLKCNVHPWMNGFLGVLPHPYFAVTGPDGSFEIKNLPPGKYGVEAWHEKLGVQTQEILVKTSEITEIEFKFNS